MRYAFILYAGKTVSFKRVEYDLIGDVSKRLDWVKEQIGCEWVEVVNLPRFIENSCLLIDEEGLINTENPELNYIGSVLYGTPQHGSPIVGNALLCTTQYVGDGYDTVGFDVDTAAEVEKLLKSMQAEAK